jgi:hypothetical protein
MEAWCTAFGKPLLCVIAGADAVRGYRFDGPPERWLELETVEAFPRGIIIGVEGHGREVPP